MIELPNPADIMRAYGCPAQDAVLIASGTTAFGAAVLGLGPIRVWYSEERGGWTLDQRPTAAPLIIAHWKRLHGAGRAGVA